MGEKIKRVYQSRKIIAQKPKMRAILKDCLTEDGREESGRALTPEVRRQVSEYLGDLASMLLQIEREKAGAAAAEAGDSGPLSRSKG